MPLSPSDRCTVRAVVTDASARHWVEAGWLARRPRGDGFTMIERRFASNAEVKMQLDAFAAGHVTAWVE